MAEDHRKAENLPARVAEPGMDIRATDAGHDHFHKDGSRFHLVRKGIGTNLKGLLEADHDRCFSGFHESLFSLSRL